MSHTEPELRPSEEEALKFFEESVEKLSIVAKLRRLKPKGENFVLGALRDVQITASLFNRKLRQAAGM
jgi:hypothetical protein